MLERRRIQHDAALLLPLAVTGSHVGPRRCHASRRMLDIRVRAWVAEQRHMGFEMDPRELSKDKTQVLIEVTPGGNATTTGCAKPTFCGSTAPVPH